MTHQQILEKAITKAIEGGWKEQGIKWLYQLNELADMPDFDMKNPDNFNVIIYNHEFAKALWGDKLFQLTYRLDAFDGATEERKHLKHWQYHLQQMVIADDPIAYLGENI